MGFDTGNISFTRFSVIGDAPLTPDQATLDRFAALALREDELTTAEVDYGWTGPKHHLDGDFSAGNCIFNDCLFMGLRIDTNKVPAPIKRAYIGLEENALARANPSGFASKQQKRAARDVVKRQIEEDLASGKFRRSKSIPILWDLQTQTLYAPVSGSAAEQLIELFERTMNLTLEPITSGTEMLSFANAGGRRREYEDLTPTRFATIPGDPPAEYPWTAKGDQAKDYLGNEFLVWLWHSAATNGGAVASKVSASGEHTVMFTKTMHLDCCYGQTGNIGISFEDPTALVETIDAIRSGKVPRKAGLTIAIAGQLYILQLNAETLAVTGLKLPEVEKADSPRVLFEERITLLRDFMKSFDGLYSTFLGYRTGGGWSGIVDQIRRWQAGKGRAA